MADAQQSLLGRRLLGLGALAGIALAGLSIARPSLRPLDLDADTAATVNGVPISKEAYRRAVAALRTSRRDPRLGATDRHHALQRLIDEELLLQRALSLGLARSDSAVRASLNAAMIASLVAEVESRPGGPSEAELRRHYAAHSRSFRGVLLLRVQRICFRAPAPGPAGAPSAAPTRRARQARARLIAGEPFVEVAASGDPCAGQLPDALLPLSKLADYVGPTAARAVSRLAVGQVSEPVRSATEVSLLRVVQRRSPKTPAFEEVREQVRLDYRRRAADRRLREYLDNLRADGQIHIAKDLASETGAAL
jgi:hypothetical protein